MDPPPEARLGHCLPGLVNILLSIAALVEAGCKIFFRCTRCEVTVDGAIILQGWRDPKNRLWRVKIVDDGWKTDYKVAIPTQGKPTIELITPPNLACLQPLRVLHYAQAHTLLLRVPELPLCLHFDQGYQCGIPPMVASAYR
jgi:hypothetical protein